MMTFENNHNAAASPRSLLITGATGTLGNAFARICYTRNLNAVVLNRAELDIAEPESIEQALAKHNPWAVVNTAGYVRVDEAETDEARCFRENATGPRLLAEACARHGVQLLTFSSDLVFDGAQETPYLESHQPNPQNAYGRSKLQAERDVLTALPSALVVRASAFFSPWDEHNFIHFVLQALQRGETFEAADDVCITPTYVYDLVNTSLDLLIDKESGIWHLANHGSYTWAEFARRAAEMAGFDPDMVIGKPMAAFGLPAARPRYTVLESERAWLMPTVEHGLERYLNETDYRSHAVDVQMADAGVEVDESQAA
ncbi:dTDP-4-dehydrorhamnose reductase [Hymenobacter busanensis]|uniref:dTDP-4-dehydrorhamnose reductase n=1 Tax=Hymenobacter busanensis TaxID=2607656 RepID=UPI00191BDCFD|nr:dTDP-4-dehydrorhamnose reductase [Hymenobacter busanensis]